MRGFDTEHTGRGKGTRKRGGRKRGKAARRQDALRKKEPWSGLTPDGATVRAPGAVRPRPQHTGGARGRPAAGKQAGGSPSRLEGGGRGCSEMTAGLLSGPGRGVAATGIPQGHPSERRSRAKPGLPVCHRPPEGRGIGGRSTQDPQHQQAFEEFAGPSGLPSSSSSSANANSLLARVRRPSSSFLWACSTSSVSRVKDSLMLRLVQALVS